MKSWFSGLSRAGRIGVVLASLAVGGVAASAGTTPTKPPSPTPSNTSQAVKKDVVETKTITETQPIPFEKTTVNDDSLAKGKTHIRTAGVNGVKTLTYKIKITNGAQTIKELVKQEVTKAPVSQVNAVGTYVYVAPQPVLNCPNGTYTNSDGNEVCSPYSAPSAPAGATAQCNDGSYSFSQHRSGTCSHHGGVASWL